MKFEFELKGIEEVDRAMRLLEEQAPKAMGKALWNEANDIMRAAKILTPVDTGVLKGSGHVPLPEDSGHEVTVTMGFGGAAAAYAEVQHEELSYYHDPPTQAKYLEQPFYEAVQDGIGLRIAKSLRESFRGKL